MYRGSLIVLAVAFIAVGVNGNVIWPKVPMPDGRIVGGESTTIDRFPHQVSVRLLGSHICGGSIVNERVVITAAHCIYAVGASYYSVAFGSTNVSGGKTVSAERLLKHQNYNSDVIDFDIALIFLKSSIAFSASAKPIPLATEEPAPGTVAIVSGWGATAENGSSASVLQKVEVQIISRSECSQKYSNVNAITDNMVCAGVQNGGKDACQGDSGGPLIANGVLVGIVSWGVGCAQPNYPGVYTNVAHLRPWIDSNLA